MNTGFRATAGIFALIGIILIPLAFVAAEEGEDELAILMLIAGGALFLFAIQYLLAKEFAFAAEEKGYFAKAYFWYVFLLGIVGMLLVIALPNKTPIKIDRQNQ